MCKNCDSISTVGKSVDVCDSLVTWATSDIVRIKCFLPRDKLNIDCKMLKNISILRTILVWTVYYRFITDDVSSIKFKTQTHCCS